MALKGNLTDLALADLLSLLSQQNKSGYIEIVKEKKKAHLTLNRGDIVYVSIGTITPERKITKALLSGKRLQPSHLKEFEHQAALTGNSTLSILVSKKVISQEECQTWIQIAAEELAMEMVSWNKGNYHFQSASTRHTRKESAYFLKTDFIILEGLRQNDEWERLRQHLPSSKSVLKVAKPDYADYELGQDIYIMNAVNGMTTVQDLMHHLPFNGFRYYNGVKSLMREGFLEAVKSQRFHNVRPTPLLSFLTWHKRHWPMILVGLMLALSLSIHWMANQWVKTPANPPQFEAEQTFQTLFNNWEFYQNAFYQPTKPYQMVQKHPKLNEFRHAEAE